MRFTIIMTVHLLRKLGIVNVKTYRQIYLIGYLTVFITALLPFRNDMHNKTISVITVDFHLDQILHAVVYSVICIYFILGKMSGLVLFEKQNLLKFLITVLFLAVITELIQILIPSRVFNLYDLLANLTGILLTFCVFIFIRKSEKRPE